YFVVYTKDSGAGTWTQSTGWTMAVTSNEDGQTLDAASADEGPTGKNNFITLTNSTGIGLKTDGQVKVVFFGTDDNYITNPGSGAFFVKINTYNDEIDRDEVANLVD